MLDKVRFTGQATTDWITIFRARALRCAGMNDAAARIRGIPLCLQYKAEVNLSRSQEKKEGKTCHIVEGVYDWEINNMRYLL